MYLNLVQLRSQSISEEWCDWEGKPASRTSTLPSIHMVSSGLVYASPSMLQFHWKSVQLFAFLRVHPPELSEWIKHLQVLAQRC